MKRILLTGGRGILFYAEYQLEEIGLKHRISELMRRDDDNYSSALRDLRLDLARIGSCGVGVIATFAAIRSCVNDYGFKVMKYCMRAKVAMR